MLAHAVIDALLGAAGLGDIGQHFPDTDERWRDADSIDLLREVRGAPGRAAAACRVNVDATVICEAPKLGPTATPCASGSPRRSGCAAADVNVKFTTSEGMGFVGRGEGIAALATAAWPPRADRPDRNTVSPRWTATTSHSPGVVALRRGMVRDGQVSSRELVELYLDRIGRLDPALNSTGS